LLEAYGIVLSGQQIDQLRPKQCPNCTEPNKPDSKFCNKCRMIMSYDAYAETLDEQKKKESEVQILKEKYELDMKTIRGDMEKRFQQILDRIDISKVSNK
jgi:predicted nucleic acid-binding Zn ribbon protein